MNTPNTVARCAALALAATAVGLSLTACGDISGTQTNSAPPASTATVKASQDATPAGAAQDSQDDSSSDSAGDDSGFDSDSDVFTVPLDKEASWKNGVTARLGGFSRGKVSEYAPDAGKAYLAFSITMFNGSKTSLDLSMVDLSCPDGADEVFDEDSGFNGEPDVHLLPGKSETWKTACVFPKSSTSVQLEIEPTDTTGDGLYSTAIFTGEVK